MFDWLKNIGKDAPEFWRNYLQSFQEKPKRMTMLHLIKSGTQLDKDVVFALGAIQIENDAVLVETALEIVIPQYRYLHDNALPLEYQSDMGKEKLHQNQAVERLVDYLQNSILIGHRPQNDLDFLFQLLEPIGGGRLRNEALDLEIMHQKAVDNPDASIGLFDMFELYKIPYVPSGSPTEVAYSMGLLFLKLKDQLQITTPI